MKNKFLFLLLGIFLASPVFPQSDSVLPDDPAVRTGRLPNGMTYYIRYNDYPKGYADFEIFHRVGALQEEDTQNGLAHFLEHLAFNGLAHFPGKSMIDYMESIGVKFGSNVNAATSQEYTRYMLRNVPTVRSGIIDTCLLVLSDWSGSILCEPAEIDAERGVIEEEWRSRGGLNFRLSEVLNPVIFNHSKYATHNVIGDMDIIRNFKREELLDFYKRWYHPDMQAVAIVGDFDPDRMETQVKELFSQLPATRTAPSKVTYTVPDHPGMVYVKYTDKEVAKPSISLLFRHPSQPWDIRNTERGYIQNYERYLLCQMMNERLQSVIDETGPCVASLRYSYDALAEDKDIFSVSAEVKGGGKSLLPAFDFMLQENERFKRHGFTLAELERVKARANRNLEKSYAERDKKTNTKYMQGCFYHFVKNQPMLSAEEYDRVLRKTLGSFTLEKANILVKSFFGKDNIIVAMVASSADSTEIPLQAAIDEKMTSLPSWQVEPYHEKELPQSFLTAEPIPGRVIDEEKLPFGALRWTLSNGAKVCILPTDCQKDEIQISAYRWGGFSLVEDTDYSSARLLASALQTARLGRLRAKEREKMLAGKIVYLHPLCNDYQCAYDCASTPSDYKTLLQLLYLYFTDMHFDEEAFARSLTRYKENLIARKAVPFTDLQDTVALIRNNYHPRAATMRPEEVDQVSLRRIEKVHRKLFGNPADFIFFFTGAIDPGQARPLIEKYIGSLKNHRQKLQWQDIGIRSPGQMIECDLRRSMETPKATAFIEYTRTCDYTEERSILLRLLKGILDIRFNALIREEKSAAYSVDTECSLKTIPVSQMNLIVSFDTQAEKVDELKPSVHEELKRLVREGIDPEDFNKSREYLYKTFAQARNSNLFWHSLLINYVRLGHDSYTETQKLLEHATPEDVRRVLEELVSAGHYVSVTLHPE